MKKILGPFRFLLIAVAGWMNQAQEQVIEYLREENHVLRDQPHSGYGSLARHASGEGEGRVEADLRKVYLI